MLSAVIRKEAVLAVFDFENEVVVDPTVPKVEVERHFLHGAKLRAFRKWIDVSRRGEQMLFDEAPRVLPSESGKLASLATKELANEKSLLPTF